jgi:hypothetical protein
MFKKPVHLALGSLAALGLLGTALGRAPAPWGAGAPADEPPAAKPAPGPGAAPTVWTTAVTPKPLSAAVKKGLDWLVEHQHPTGGWSQGEESPQMRGSGPQSRDTPDVADTCAAALALIRSGSTPREGPYRGAVAKAVAYVRAQVEKSDGQSLAVSDVQGTRVQMKLGPHIDTFLASLLLAEVKGRMPDGDSNRAVDLALNKVLDKIKRNQKADGTWDNQTGWAPILAQSIGGKGLNRAAQAGAAVPEAVLDRAANFAVAQNKADEAARAAAPAAVAAAEPPVAGSRAGPSRGAVGGSALASSAPAGRPYAGGMMGGRGYSGMGSAGVELYGRSSSLSVLQDSVNTFAYRETELRKKAENGSDEKERDQARRGLAQIAETRQAHRDAQAAMLARLDDAGFVSGFGSNGGEEFLSYMNISESLVVKGGLDWKRWDDAMASNLGRVQNDDGSWTGHHCITGRTFCTSTALLVLLADRTPVPVNPAKPAGEAK